MQSILEYVIQDPTVNIETKGVKLDKQGWPIEPILDYEIDPATGAAVLHNVTGTIAVSY